MKEPSNWSEITLGQYREVLAARNRNLSDYGKLVQIIAVACSASPATVKRMEKPDFLALTNRLRWVFETQPKGEPLDRFEIKGQLYMVPSDIGRRSIGEYADADDAAHVYPDDAVMQMARIIAVYCRKPGEPVIDDLKTLEDRTQLMLHLPSTTADSLNGFFLTSVQVSALNSRLFTLRRAELLTETGIWLNSVKHGGGWPRFTRWPKTIFLRWMRSRAALAGKS